MLNQDAPAAGIFIVKESFFWSHKNHYSEGDKNKPHSIDWWHSTGSDILPHPVAGSRASPALAPVDYKL